MFRTRMLRILGVVTLGMTIAIPIHAAGFLIFEQGSKAMGMAGAFTAQADDPSALFHNAAGIAFQNERGFQLGGTWVQGDVDFTGAPPFPGPGVTERTDTLSEIIPHFYWVEPISDRWTFGLGLNAPFGLSVEWKDPDDFSGRFISTFSSLTAVDLNPTIGWKASENFGIGLGFVARISEVELENRQFSTEIIPGVNLEVAKSRLEGGRDEGYGWNLGILHRYNNSFHWGLSYRSTMEIDYGGELTLTQIPTGNPILDGILASRIPFNQAVPGATSIEFPDIASLGLGFALSPAVWMEIDVNWTGWSTFDRLIVAIDSPALDDLDLVQNWDDVFQYRLGFRWNSSARSQWRIGYIYDETPQPSETVSPVLPDANRNDFTLGYGYQGGKVSLDVAGMYVSFDDRTVAPARNSEVPYFGTYNQDAWLLGVTVGF